MNSDTPRTDEYEFKTRGLGNFQAARLADFARQLERELNEQKKEVQHLSEQLVRLRIKQ